MMVCGPSHHVRVYRDIFLEPLIMTLNYLKLLVGNLTLSSYLPDSNFSADLFLFLFKDLYSPCAVASTRKAAGFLH